jgi:uncharacterized SAM-binding protein YcdF (DUF218 family)
LTTYAAQNYYSLSAMNTALERFRRSYRILLLLGGLNVLLFLIAVFVFLRAGSWLVREDGLQRAAVVVVLSGGLPERALAAADVFKSAGASEVWLTRPLEPGAAMQRLRLPYSGEEQYSRMVLIDRGVPAAAIHVLEPHITSTVEELQAVYARLGEQPDVVLIVVTSKAHTRRVRALWKVVSGGAAQRRLLVRAAPADPFDAEHWWRSSNDVLSVVREYLGLLNAWFGLPLHHSR